MSSNFPIIFSPHALIKLAQRGLTRDMVIRTVERPVHLVSVGDRMYAFRKFGSLYLRVIFTRTEHGIIVITAHFVKKLP